MVLTSFNVFISNLKIGKDLRNIIIEVVIWGVVPCSKGGRGSHTWSPLFKDIENGAQLDLKTGGGVPGYECTRALERVARLMPSSLAALNAGVCGPLLRAAIQFDFLIAGFRVPIQQAAPMRASISCRFLWSSGPTTLDPQDTLDPLDPRHSPDPMAPFCSSDNELCSKRSSMTTTHRWHQQRIWFIKSQEKNKAESWQSGNGNGNCKSANHFRVKGPTKSAIRFPFRGPPTQNQNTEPRLGACLW